LLCCPLIVSSLQLVVASSLIVLVLCCPLVLSSCWLVVVLPYTPSCPLGVRALICLAITLP
jgi:hypothetical protein